MADKAVYTTKHDLLLFFHLLDTDPTIQKFLHHDKSFCLADKYLIAMVFIYFKRARLSPEDYTYLNFFAGLCLAHSMEEDLALSFEIYPWALGYELQSKLPKLLELKMLLWMAMDYRAAVSQYCCKKLISISERHPIWKRERSPSVFENYLPVKMDLLNYSMFPEKDLINSKEIFIRKNHKRSKAVLLK